MNDKQKLAAMGAQYRLTEEQAKGLAERMPQTGALQVLDDEPLCTEIRINGVEACGADIGGLLDRCLPHTTEQQPLCMAKRIEELEARVRVMAGLLREAQRYVRYRLEYTECDARIVMGLICDIDAALAGNLPSHVPECWQLVPMEPTERMISESIDAGRFDEDDAVFFWASMLASAPSPDGAK